VVDVPALGTGASDDAVFAYAVAVDRVLVTKNGADFVEIAQRPESPAHPGILVVHYDRAGASLPIATIVRAVENAALTYETTKALVLDVNQHVW
jgi:predicted nuclease of predicted toxin-antitoxin system